MDDLRPYSKDQLAVWYYNEVLKSKEAKATAIHKAMGVIMEKIHRSETNSFYREFTTLLSKYGVLPAFKYDMQVLLLNGDVHTVDKIRNRCKLDEDGNHVLKD